MCHTIFQTKVQFKVRLSIKFADMMKQKSLLVQCPHIVVATPGRLADLLHSTHCHSLHNIKFLVSLMDIPNVPLAHGKGLLCLCLW